MKKLVKNHPIYGVWTNMKSRCTNPNSTSFQYYGAKGVTYDTKWEKFNNFKKDMEPSYKKGLWLDRIDNSKGYYPENCRWVTPKDQENHRSNNHLFSYMGIADTLQNWANYLKVNKSTLSMRIYVYGWDIKKTLETPVGKRRDNFA